MNENRVIRVDVPERFVLEIMLGSVANLPRVLCFPLMKQLPEGYKVLSVHSDWQRRSFSFLVQHDSFGEVKPGELIPEFPKQTDLFWYQIALTPEQRKLIPDDIQDCDTPIILERAS